MDNYTLAATSDNGETGIHYFQQIPAFAGMTEFGVFAATSFMKRNADIR